MATAKQARPVEAPPSVPNFSALDLYSDSDTDTEDEWFNSPDHPPQQAQQVQQVQTHSAETGQSSDELQKPREDRTNPLFVKHAADPRATSGPLDVPSLYVTPSTPALDDVAPPPGPPPGHMEKEIARPTSAPPAPPSDVPQITPPGLPPAYEPRGSTDERRPSLSRSSTTGSDVSESSLPPYETVASASSTSFRTAPGFYPTRHLQIETKGIGMIRIPMIPPRSDPVLIRSVSHEGVMGPAAFKSLQSSRTSGSCVLVDGETDIPLCTTTYAPGPVRPPKLRLVKISGANKGTINLNAPVVTPQEAGKYMKIKPPFDAEFWPVTGDRPQSRACSIRTSFGHFRWRYGNRAEKRDAKGPIMIFERIREVTTTDAKGKTKKTETRKRIGQLLRSEEMRTAGSNGMAAGNGGRVMLDLNEWADRKEEGRGIEVIAVASCLVMLRKEMNQRRLRQAAVMMTTAAIL